MSRRWKLKLRRDRKPGDARWRHGLWPARSVERFVVSFPKSGRTWLRVMMAVAEAGARGEAIAHSPSQRPGGSLLSR